MEQFILSLSPLNVSGEAGTLAYTLVLALLPPVLWLFICLWLNRKHPRRRGFLLTAFFLGALAVAAALPLERFALGLSSDQTTLTVLWAATEELLKCCALLLVALFFARRFNGPRDYALAAVTVGLGFAGLENTLFIFHPIAAHNLTEIALSGRMRFLGANLLHAVTTSAVGLGLGFAYFNSAFRKIAYALIGICVAVAVHSVFNLKVEYASQLAALYIFGALWVLALLSVIFWRRLQTMEGSAFIKNRWTEDMAAKEETWNALLKSKNISLGDSRPLREILKPAGLFSGTREYADFKKLAAFLEERYALRLQEQGLKKSESEKAAGAILTNDVSAKTIATIFAILKKEDAIFTASHAKLVVLDRAE